MISVVIFSDIKISMWKVAVKFHFVIAVGSNGVLEQYSEDVCSAQRKDFNHCIIVVILLLSHTNSH